MQAEPKLTRTKRTLLATITGWDSRPGLHASVRGMLAVAVLAAACSWVELTAQGRDVQMVDRGQAAGCRRVGDATAVVPDRILFVNRAAARVAEDIVVLARNQAAELGGDTIVATEPIERGRQTFAVYACR